MISVEAVAPKKMNASERSFTKGFRSIKPIEIIARRSAGIA